MLFLIIVLILSTIPLNAQNTIRVESTAKVYVMNITPDDAKQKSLQAARNEAIKIAVGLNIVEETFRKVIEESTNGDSQIIDYFSKLNRTSSSGKIIEEDYSFATELKGDIPLITCRLSALVQKESIEPDPEFSVKIILDKEKYYSIDGGKSDYITPALWSSKNCYFYLFNIMSNDSVQLILPNEYISDNLYEVGSSEQNFEKKMNELGMKFKATLPEGKYSITEALYLVALKEKLDFRSDSFSKDNSSVIPTYKAAFADIASWFVKIPANKRTDDFKSFVIERK